MANSITRLWFKIKWWWRDTASKHMPRIPRRFPKPPERMCAICGKPFTKIAAIDTGDGWAFEWGCDDDCCNDNIPIDCGWFPFVFGWATRKDLKRIGIEEG